MSDLAHKFDRYSRACVCGSVWNWYAESCSYIVPLPETVAVQQVFEDDSWDTGFFECRKGHAFCARH